MRRGYPHGVIWGLLLISLGVFAPAAFAKSPGKATESHDKAMVGKWSIAGNTTTTVNGESSSATFTDIYTFRSDGVNDTLDFPHCRWTSAKAQVTIKVGKGQVHDMVKRVIAFEHARKHVNYKTSSGFTITARYDKRHMYNGTINGTIVFTDRKDKRKEYRFVYRSSFSGGKAFVNKVAGAGPARTKKESVPLESIGCNIIAPIIETLLTEDPGTGERD